MELLKRKCPNCKVEIPLRERMHFVVGRIIDCPKCAYKVQPTILWGAVTAILFSYFSYHFFYSFFNDTFGEDVASVLVIVIALLAVKVFEPFADLQAHHKDERLF